MALQHGLKELQQPHWVVQRALCLQQHDAPRRRFHLAAPRADVVAADDHLALQLVSQLMLQQPRRPTALVTRADDQQPALSVAGRLFRPAQPPHGPRSAHALALLALRDSLHPSIRPFRSPGLPRDDAQSLFHYCVVRWQPRCQVSHVLLEHVLHLANVSDALLAHVGHHLGHTPFVVGLHLPHEITEQRACIVLSPTAANQREEHDGNLIHCRLPHLQQAPRPRQDALRGKDD
eukprot:scaffold22164_cov68-Phaeocystis_antarctica.AAC.3